MSIKPGAHIHQIPIYNICNIYIYIASQQPAKPASKPAKPSQPASPPASQPASQPPARHQPPNKRGYRGIEPRAPPTSVRPPAAPLTGSVTSHYTIAAYLKRVGHGQESQPAKPAKHSQPARRPASHQPTSHQPVKKKHGAQTRYGSGVRGQAFKNHTGLENEVGTPRQLLDVPDTFRCSYTIHIISTYVSISRNINLVFYWHTYSHIGYIVYFILYSVYLICIYTIFIILFIMYFVKYCRKTPRLKVISTDNATCCMPPEAGQKLWYAKDGLPGTALWLSLTRHMVFRLETQV